MSCYIIKTVYSHNHKYKILKKHKPLYFKHSTVTLTQKLTYQQLIQHIIGCLL